MYFLTKIFQGVKTTLAALCLFVSSGIIVFGIITVTGGTLAGWAAIVGGVLCLIPSAFAVFESTKLLNDIRKEIDNFKSQIKVFEEQNAVFHTENDRLKTNVDDLEETKATKNLDARADIMHLFRGNATGSDTVAFKDTSYGLYNAVVEWADYHKKGTKAGARWLGVNSGLKEKAFDLAMQLATA